MSLETPNETVTTAGSVTAETVNTEVETTTQETSVASEQNEQSQVETQAGTQTVSTPINADLYDERGVPWKNVAMEQRRKYEETQSNLPKLVAEEIAKTTQQAQQKKYTIAELEQFAIANPDHRAWVEQEKAALLKAEIAQDFDQRIAATNKKQQDEMVRGQVFNKVLTTFPDIAIRDQQGNFLGWNNMNPMTQAMGKYMSSPELQNRPDGLEVAAKLAYADIALAKTPQTQKQIQGLKGQLKKVQAQTFIEGGGRKVSESVSPVKKHIERVSVSGKTEDAAGVFREIHKQMGMTKE